MHAVTATVLPGELVFDIGAHVGDKSAWFAERGARVIAIEPQSKQAESLRARFENNTNVTVINKGVAAAAGQMEMKVNTSTPVLSTFSEHWTKGRFVDYEWDAREIIEMTTMDALIEEFGVPRYVKIDVEGFEKEVVLGLNKKVDLLSFEFTREFADDAHFMIDYLGKLGFRYANISLGEAAGFVEPRWVGIDRAHDLLTRACAADPLAWGDVYLC